MKSDPVLASTLIRREYYKNRVRFRVYGGMHYIRGNSSPHFSLTCGEFVGGNMVAGGAAHEEILRVFPRFADLAALHLSDIDGTPLHAVDNGFFHLGGCTDHRPGRKWGRDGAGNPYGPNYAHAASVLRISEDAARKLPGELFGPFYSEAGGFMTPEAEAEAKAAFAAWVDSQRPRWKAEADSCVATHGLRVFGDPWPVAA